MSNIAIPNRPFCIYFLKSDEYQPLGGDFNFIWIKYEALISLERISRTCTIFIYYCIYYEKRKMTPQCGKTAME